MKKQAAEMAQCIERAVKSGKLNLDSSYTTPQAGGNHRHDARATASSRQSGIRISVASFCTHVGFGLKKAVVVTGILGLEPTPQSSAKTKQR
jgi:hypothetical protein